MFDSESPGDLSTDVVDLFRKAAVRRLPSATQWTAVDASGGEVAFDPQSPGRPPPVTIDPTSDDVLAGGAARARRRAHGRYRGIRGHVQPQADSRRLSPVGSSSSPVAISCPTDQCVVVDSGGGADIFGPNGASNTTIDGSVPLTSVSCFAVTSGTECVAVDVHGNEVAAVVIALGSSSSILAANPVGIDATDSDRRVMPGGKSMQAVDTSGNAITFGPVHRPAALRSRSTGRPR